MTYTEKGLITTIDHLVPEGSTDGTTAEAPQCLDQYHAGGSHAVERLLVTLMPSPSDIVLDIGSGLGGPARQVAAALGCRVTGVDTTEAYVEVAAEDSGLTTVVDEGHPIGPCCCMPHGASIPTVDMPPAER
jgi:sarcosine/dimethylglycine N-methyltransferase